MVIKYYKSKDMLSVISFKIFDKMTFYTLSFLK